MSHRCVLNIKDDMIVYIYRYNIVMSCWQMPFKVDYIFSLTMLVSFEASNMCYDTILINSRVSGFICCTVYQNPIIFYMSGTLHHSYKNKANNVRLLPVLKF